jgi:hypothetical protein
MTSNVPKEKDLLLSETNHCGIELEQRLRRMESLLPLGNIQNMKSSLPEERNHGEDAPRREWPKELGTQHRLERPIAQREYGL